MSTDITSLFGIIINSIVILINSYFLFRLNRKSKSYELTVTEMGELNTKMHDRLVDVEFKLKRRARIPDSLAKRLLYNSSRLTRFDPSINWDTHTLINNWEMVLEEYKAGRIQNEDFLSEREKMIQLIDRIKKKTNKLRKQIG